MNIKNKLPALQEAPREAEIKEPESLSRNGCLDWPVQVKGVK